MKQKITLVFSLILLASGSVFAQSKDDLKAEIEQLKQQNQIMLQMLQQSQMQQQGQQSYQQMQGAYPQQSMYPQQQIQGQVLPSQFGQAVQRTRVEEIALTSTGTDIRAYGRDQSAKSNFARNKAENQARMELARQIEGYARYAINQYNEETTAGGNTWN